MKIYLTTLIFILQIQACIFDNRAIRGGAIVDKYNTGGIDLPIEEVFYKNTDGSMLYAWFIKKTDHGPLPTIIFLHGSSGNLLYYLPAIRNLHQNIDADIFACDFPGTGASKGKLSLENTLQMTIAAIDYLTNERAIRGDKIILFGVSMGATLAFYGASKREIAMIIIDSGVTSANDYLKKYSLTGTGLPDFLLSLLGENFDNYPPAKSVKNPKLFLHGEEDRIIEIRYARSLYEQAAEPKDFLWVKGRHVLFRDADSAREVSKKVRAFIEAHILKHGLKQKE